MVKVIEKPIMVTQSFLPPHEEYCKEIKRIWNSHWLTNHGKLHQELEEKMKSCLGVEELSLYTNGHLGLEAALEVLDMEGEVITTPFTFASSTHAIINRGLTPVFCDINLEDYTIDVSKIESLITPRTSAILAVHVFGNPCDVEALEQIARKHNLKWIYDAAHVFGVKWKERGIGTFGDISMFSLHATKVFHTIEGGALTYSDASLNEKLRLYQNFGIAGPESVVALGINAKMNEFQAAMGLVNLRHLEQQISERKRVYEHYLKRLQEVPGIVLLYPRKEVSPNYSYFPIVVKKEEYGHDRNELIAYLQQRNVFPRKYFYPLTSDFECFDGKYVNVDIPNARYIAEQVLTLPMYAALTEEEIDYICDEILCLNQMKV